MVQSTHCRKGLHEMTPDNTFYTRRERWRNCRACHRIAEAASQARRTPEKLEEDRLYTQAYNAAYYAERRELLDKIKSVPCMDCKQTYPSFVMDFDHRPGETKLFVVGRLARANIKTLLAEIAKCDVVCSNCHRIRTFTRSSARQQTQEI